MTASDNTGPQYPSAPGAGSNAIGKFVIGISSIGDIPSFNYWQTIISQYANSPILTQLIANIDSYLDQTQNLDSFYDLIWNVDTAQGYGLDVWGRIVGVNRTLEVPVGNWWGFAEALPGSNDFNYADIVTINPSFGFLEALPSSAPLGFGVFGIDQSFALPSGESGGAFYSGETLNSNYNLSDQSYRMLIFAKAAANITNGSIPAINQILLNLFPHRGNCYVTEGNPLPSWFGFEESGNAFAFNQGTFYDGESLPTMTMTYTFEFQLSDVELAIVQTSGVLPKPTGVKATTVII